MGNVFKGMFGNRKIPRKKKPLSRLPQLVPVDKNDQSIILGVGHPLLDVQTAGLLSLPGAFRKGHFWCFGTTRIGKTRLLEAMVEQDIRLGNSVVVIDPKGDIDLFNKIVQIADEENRTDDLMLLSPIFPNCSVKIDPLSHYFMPEEIVNHVISGIKAKEEFFINIAYEVSLVVVNALILFARIKGVPPELSFQKIKDRISYPDLKRMREQLESIHDDEAQEIMSALDQILSSPADYFAKVSSTLRTTLTALCSGNVGKILGRVESNKFITKLESGKPVIMVVQTGSLLTRKTAHIIARVFISMIQSFVGRMFASGRTLSPPMCIYADEAANVLYVGIEELFSKAGGANVWVHAFSQSISDLTSELQLEAYAFRILDNTNTKVFMRVNNPETAMYISEYAGTKNRFSPILSLGGGIAVREMEEPNIRPEAVMNLQNREFYLFTYSGAYKGRCVTVPEAKVDIRYPNIIDIGGKMHEDAIPVPDVVPASEIEAVMGAQPGGAAQ